jgi:DNA-binding SARP family transcriptional activator
VPCRAPGCPRPAARTGRPAPTPAARAATPAGHPAAPPAPARPPQLARLRYTVHGPDPARGVTRDTLWGIAERFLGDGRRYGEIYQLNKDREQPAGGRLTDPDHILPGWVLDLPADAHDRLATTPKPPPEPPAPPHPPAAPPATSPPGPGRPSEAGATQRPAPPPTTARPTATTAHQEHQPAAAPTDTTLRRHRPAIRLPGGSVVGPSLAAAIAAALALALLHRRRRWHPSPPRPRRRFTDPLITPAVRLLLRAASGADQADQADQADDGHDEAVGAPRPKPTGVPAPPAPPGIVAVAQQGDTEATADLTAGGLGLVGPSAPAAARAIIATLLGHARPDTAEVLVAGQALAGQLLGDPLPLPGLTVTDSLDDALNTVEVELLRRTRLLADHDIVHVAAYATVDPAEPLETLILVADGRARPFTPRLHAVLLAGRRLGIGAVLLGANPAGPTAVADPAGTIIEPSDTAAALLGARLYTLTVDEAQQLLRVIAAGRGAEPALPDPASPPAEEPAPTRLPQPDRTDPPAAEPPPTRPRPVEVRLLGPLQVHLHGRQLTKGLRTKTPELLAYLLVHPAGVTRDAAIEALWPELDPDRGVAWFKAVLGNLRRVLGPAAATDTAVIARVVDRYHANPDLVGCDLWRLQQALTTTTTTGAAADPAAKTTALQQALAAYHGDLLDGTDYDWALTDREDLRRQAINAARQLADLHEQADDHDQALDVLDRAVRFDPYNEELYQRIMRVQARLGRAEEIRRTYRRLELRMADLDDDPSETTRQLRDQLLRAARPPSHYTGR